MKRIAAALVFLVPAAWAQNAGSQKAVDDRPYTVMVGDPAPPMAISRWISRGPVEAVQAGKPYVVEFWATWCIPCIAGVPHLTKLQAEYGDRVTVVGVNVWDPGTPEVERFMQEQGDRMRYLIALDEVPPLPAGDTNAKKWSYEQGAMSKTWLKASGAWGIPIAYIVDGQGRLAWMGDPMQVDEPLNAIVEGRWDLTKFARDHEARMTAQKKSEPIIERLRRARQEKDTAASLVAVDELIALGPSLARFAGEKFEILLTEAGEPARAYAYAHEAISGVAKDDKSALNQIANVILKQPEGKRDLHVALLASRRAEAVTEAKNSRTLKTLAEVHAARGDMKEAIEVQRRAVGIAFPEERDEFEALLAELVKRGEGK